MQTIGDMLDKVVVCVAECAINIKAKGLDTINIYGHTNSLEYNQTKPNQTQGAQA
jgi:hypothetical protein